MGEIKIIETRYRGYKFRSRLEARWAVFFDALCLPWEYEKEGFELPSGRYLPDFWLPMVHMWAEVKAEEFSPRELALCSELSLATGYPCLLLAGVPENKPYDAVEAGWDNDSSRSTTKVSRIDFCLSNYHGYPRKDGRFYCMPGSKEDGMYEDTALAADKARSARFEHGESGAAR